MKETKSLENLLASWTPRRPSAKLNSDLFGRLESARSAEPALASLGLLVRNGLVAMAVFAMMAVLVVGGMSPLAGVQARGMDPMLGAISASNQNLASYLPGDHSRLNVSSAPILGWTNEGQSNSSNGSFRLSLTNGLR